MINIARYVKVVGPIGSLATNRMIPRITTFEFLQGLIKSEKNGPESIVQQINVIKNITFCCLRSKTLVEHQAEPKTEIQ